MRFVFSLLALRPGRVGGTEHYMRELLRALPAVQGGDELVVLAGRDTAEAVATPGLERRVVDFDSRELVLRRGAEAFTSWRDGRIEQAIAELKPDAVFFPQLSMYPKAIDAPAAVMVGDLQHLAMPRNFAALDRAFRRAIYPYSLSRARIVMAMSERTRADLVTLARVTDEKIRVVRPGCPAMRSGEARAKIPLPPVAGPYLYYPAVTHPHKGHAELLQALSYLVGERAPLRLVLTGQRTRYWNRLRGKAERLGIGSRVLHLGYVAPEMVESLYAHAAAVVFPSRFEGFGLPLVEAASFGARVIASRLPVFDEHGTEGVHYIDFCQPEELRAALASARRARVREDAWSWHDAAIATMAALREAAA